MGFGFKATAKTARHFSGRTFKRGTSLWASFILKTPSFKIYLGGDSGYDTHFEKIGMEEGGFDLAILECGQYNPYWKYIHMMPEETVQAAKALRANYLMPVHWGKFTLAMHDWDDPIKRVHAAAAEAHMPMITPLIGEIVSLNQPGEFDPWWQKVVI